MSACDSPAWPTNRPNTSPSIVVYRGHKLRALDFIQCSPRLVRSALRLPGAHQGCRATAANRAEAPNSPLRTQVGTSWPCA